MKKKLVVFLISVLTFCLGIFCFAACSVESGGGRSLAFRTLTRDGTQVYGKVSNETDSFSFANEIAVTGNVTYSVASDRAGKKEVSKYSVALSVGDNIFYVLEKENAEIVETYRVTIRRRAMYTVTFDTGCEIDVETQIVEEDGYATLPSISRDGYQLVGWNYDFRDPIKRNTSIRAQWTALTTKYTVQHYCENFENDEYVLMATEEKSAPTGSVVWAEFRQYENREPVDLEVKGRVKGDGSLCLVVKYQVKRFTVTFDGQGGLFENNQTKYALKVKQGAKANPPTVYRKGYDLVAWDKTLDEVTEDVTVTAAWEIVTYDVTYDCNNGDMAGGVNPSTYTVETDFTLIAPQRKDYIFVGWYDQYDAPITNFLGCAGTKYLKARWEPVFLHAGGTLTGVSELAKHSSLQLTIPDEIDGTKITRIGTSAFENCSALEKITIPFGIRWIENSAFKDCGNLREIYFNADYCADAYVENQAYEPLFYDVGANTDGVTVVFGKDVRRVPAYLFYTVYQSEMKGVPNIKTVEFEDESICTEIGDNAFGRCWYLESVTLPDSLKNIGVNAFFECKTLAEIEIPQGVETVGEAAFCYSGLKKASIPNSVTVLGDRAFMNCFVLETLYYNASQIAYCQNTSEYYSPSNNVFYEAGSEGNGITVTFGADMTKVPAYIFCPSTGTIGISPKITNVLFEDETKITVIEEYAFSGCQQLKSISIPDSVKSIGKYAFYRCGNLSELDLGEGIVSIESRAFYACNALTEVVLPNSVKTVGASAFSSCENLTNFTVSDTLKEWGSSVLSYCDKMQYKLYNNGHYIGSKTNPYAIFVKVADTSRSLFALNLSTEFICENAMSYYEHLKEITIPNGVKKIPYAAFQGSGLEKIVIHDNVTEIGIHAFEDTKLTTITLPKGIEKIPEQAFFYCQALTEIVIPGNVKSIDSRAFTGCNALQSVVFEEGVERIESEAFWGCQSESFTRVTIPKSVNFIGRSAFELTNLNEIRFEDEEGWCKSTKTDGYGTPITWESLDVRNRVANATALRWGPTADAWYKNP